MKIVQSVDSIPDFFRGVATHGWGGRWGFYGWGGRCVGDFLLGFRRSRLCGIRASGFMNPLESLLNNFGVFVADLPGFTFAVILEKLCVTRENLMIIFADGLFSSRVQVCG